MMKLSVGYPGRPIERAILEKKTERSRCPRSRAVTSPEKPEMQQSLEKVQVDDAIIEYIVKVSIELEKTLESKLDPLQEVLNLCSN